MRVQSGGEGHRIAARNRDDRQAGGSLAVAGGATYPTRTGDLLITNQLLYQLS